MFGKGDISFQDCAQPVRRSFPQTSRLTVSKALEDADVCLRVGTDRLKTETKRRLHRDVFNYDSYIQGRSLQLPRLRVNLQVIMSSLCRLGFFDDVTARDAADDVHRGKGYVTSAGGGLHSCVAQKLFR